MKKDDHIGQYAVLICSAMISYLFLSYTMHWLFALLYLMGLLIHECGHAFCAAAYDVRVSMRYLTPFGAYVRIHGSLEEKQKLTVALSGPLCSIVFILLLYMVYELYPIDIILYAIISLTFINAVNLLPLTPFDGGKISEATRGILCLFPAIPITWAAVNFKLYYLLLLNLYFICNCMYLMKKKRSLLRHFEEKYDKINYIIDYFFLLGITFGYLAIIWFNHNDLMISIIYAIRDFCVISLPI